MRAELQNCSGNTLLEPCGHHFTSAKFYNSLDKPIRNDSCVEHSQSKKMLHICNVPHPHLRLDRFRLKGLD
eukprot:2931844-Amphidinium_carterae.1